MDPLLYCYALGGIVFVVGLAYAAKQGYFGASRRGAMSLAGCLAVALFFLAIQAYLQYAPMETAVPRTYTGGAEHVIADDGGVRGEPVDYAVMIGYFALILLVGTWYGRGQRTTKDFFFGGQRFAWWLIAFSLIATTVGSYSFVKYSEIGYTYGLGSTQTYFNDWMWYPLLVFGWLPILYFSRVVSIPEYFGRRFGSGVRLWATVYILIYLVGYVGVNLFTMGKVLNILLGWEVPVAALVVAAISASYVTVGGQTSVIMTDLLQGVLLLVAGLIVLILGIEYLGGAQAFWEHLPRDARLAFSNFNERPDFPSVGIFWQDAFANSAMLYFLNQGIAMRFMAAKSLSESRKAVFALMVALMTIGACVVASGGWVARALVHAGVLPEGIRADRAFFVATELLSRPGVFGLILAALTAALMSTVDTLITAVSAIFVNDVYRPYVRKGASDSEQLRVARLCAVTVTILGVALVPVFMKFKSIYSAHAAFTAAVTPPLVVVLLLSVFWRRFTRPAAIWTLAGGMVAVTISLFVPEVIIPFAHGVPMGEDVSGFLSGMRQQQFMRAFFGVSVSAAIAVVVTLLTRPEPPERQRGLVWGTIQDALRHYKGSPGSETAGRRAEATPRRLAEESPPAGDARLPVVRLSHALAEALEARRGDLVYVTDRRWWTGGLRSAHAVVGEIDADGGGGELVVAMGPRTHSLVVTPRRHERPVRVERLY